MSVLVTGGAGYIGGHVVLALLNASEDVVVLDDLSTGIASAVPQEAPLVRGDIGDQELVGRILRQYDIDSVMHFAGSIIVPESVADPLKYYWNNTAKSCALIQACVKNDVRHFVFSSTAAVYGAHEDGEPLAEDAPLNPSSPYATSKKMIEEILTDTATAHDFRYVALRYFNVAGADPAGRIGHSSPDATHLFKVTCQTALGLRSHLDVYGDDYPTPDGTCIRDFIHVSDLADAHLLVLAHLKAGGSSDVFNCGYGKGYSVTEVIRAFESETGQSIPVKVTGRRPGDVVAVVADSTKLRRTLNWQPRYDDLGIIVKTALAWEKKQLQPKQAG